MVFKCHTILTKICPTTGPCVYLNFKIISKSPKKKPLPLFNKGDNAVPNNDLLFPNYLIELPF